MTKSPKKFTLAVLVSAVFGCALVLIVWLMTPFNEFWHEHDGDSDAATVETSYNIDSWNSILQTTEEVFDLNVYLDLLEDKSSEDLVQLAIQTFEFEQDEQVQLFQELVITTLTSKSPATTLQLIWQFPWQRQQKLITLVVATMVTTELEGVLEIVQSVPQSYQEAALRTIVASHDELSARDWKGLVEDTRIAEHIVRLLREEEALEQLDQPSLAWDRLLEDDVANEEQIDVLVQIADARIEMEGFAALSKFHETMYHTDRFVLESILREVLDVDPKRAFQTVRSMPYKTRDFVLPILLRSWASQDPKEAYFAEVEFVDSERRLLSDRIKQWAQRDPFDVLESMSQIERADRTRAALTAIRELAKTNPVEVIERIEQLKKIPGISDQFLDWELVTSWSEIDPAEAIEWVQEATLTGSQLQGDLLYAALQNYIQVDPDRALEIAFKQPQDSSFVQDGRVGGLFSTLLLDSRNLDNAISLLADLPDSAVYGACVAVGDELIKDGRWAEALDLVNQLDDEWKRDYLSRIALGNIWRDGVQILIDLLKDLPNDATRQYITNELVRMQKSNGDVLTEQQLEAVQSLLPESD